MRKRKRTMDTAVTPLPPPTTVDVISMEHPVVKTLLGVIEQRTSSGQAVDPKSPEFKAILASLDKQGQSVVYDKAELHSIEGQAQARHMTAELLKAAGKHEAAARLRGEDAKKGFMATVGQVVEAPIKAKHVLYVIVVAGVAYALYSGLAYAFSWKGGMFGMKELPENSLQPVPM